MTAVLDAALRYASLGHRVIPIDVVKKYPYGIDGWQTLATDDPATIRGWWTGEYEGWGVGIVGGRQADGRFLLMVDVDLKDGKNGDETLADLEAEHGKLPDTVTVRTPTGGWHHYFYSPVNVRNDVGKRLGRGLDIRCDRGVVVAPPTRLIDGGLYVEDVELGFDTPIADAPEWLIHLLTFTPARVHPPRTMTDDGSLPSSVFARHANFADMLTEDGWTFSHSDRNGASYWRRPGKDRGGISASLDAAAAGILNVFSTSANVPAGGYSAFAYYAKTRHSGDWQSASRHVRSTWPDDFPADPLDPTPTARRIVNMNITVTYNDGWTETIDTTPADTWLTDVNTESADGWLTSGTGVPK